MNESGASFNLLEKVVELNVKMAVQEKETANLANRLDKFISESRAETDKIQKHLSEQDNNIKSIQEDQKRQHSELLISIDAAIATAVTRANDKWVRDHNDIILLAREILAERKAHAEAQKRTDSIIFTAAGIAASLLATILAGNFNRLALISNSIDVIVLGCSFVACAILVLLAARARFKSPSIAMPETHIELSE